MRRYRIGRAETNDIVLREPSVSREHAELFKVGGGLYVLRDLGSSYGTSVRHGSDWGLITAGDVRADTPIRIGEYETTAADLMHRAVVSAAQGGKASAAAPPKPAWAAGAPRLSERAKARHPETVFIASGSMPPWATARPRGGWMKRVASDVAAIVAERWRALSDNARLALALAAGFALFAMIAGIVLATTVIA